ncbi:MAG: Rpn family recombination-promoting nuclease/putative transposase [Bacteroidota bacterium]
MKKGKELIRFDWAMKKLLRNKANFDILEGFLSELLSQDVTIKKILESESNKEDANDKHNRVDILVENEEGELIIIEVQNSKEYDYFHRILYGTSKVITEYIDKGEEYANVKKVISITIAYFDLGQGKDYVYHGITQFKGIHKGDTLSLADRQIEIYKVGEIHEIYPEYWIIKVGKFNNIIQDKLDEWIYFLKNGAVKEEFSAKGLSEAKEKLDEINLTDEEKADYKYYLKRLRDIASEQHTKMEDAKKLMEESMEKGLKKGLKEGLEKGLKEGLEKGLEEGLEKGLREGLEKGLREGIEKKEREAVIGFFKNGVSIELIALSLQLSEEKVKTIIEEYETEQ